MADIFSYPDKEKKEKKYTTVRLFSDHRWLLNFFHLNSNDYVPKEPG
jgi:hypothetical protein